MLLKELICLCVLAVASISSAQVIDGSKFPRGPSFETDPLANYWQRWTPKMQKLFQQIRDDDGYVSHYVGAEVGSAYADEEFKPGKVYYKEEYLGDFYYRHNAYNSEIELRRTHLKEEKQIALIKDPDVSLLDIKGREVRFLTFSAKKNKKKDGYLTLLVDGNKLKLFHRLAVKYTEAKPAANSMVNATPSRFSHFTEFYFQESGSSKIFLVPLKTGKFLKLFGRENQDLEALIKKQKLDLENEKDITQIFEFLNN